MSFETVQFETREKVAFITMNRPEALNALSLRLTRELGAAFARAASEKARAVVLTGAGRAFCSGGDLREMLAMGRGANGGGGAESAVPEEFLKALHDAILLIRETPIPFVAAVGGVCAGAGTNFALACDIVLAADGAVFNEAFVKIGLSPDCGGSFFLPRAVGEKRAAELLMTGASVSAEHAAQIGMINRVVPADRLLEEAARTAQTLAQMPTASIGRIKRMLNASHANDLRSQLALEYECQIESGRSGDFKEGVSAFFEKRPPVFTGT